MKEGEKYFNEFLQINEKMSQIKSQTEQLKEYLQLVDFFQKIFDSGYEKGNADGFEKSKNFINHIRKS